MKKIKALTEYFTKAELTLWFVSLGVILLSFIIFDRNNFPALAASLIGTTALIFNAKGNPFGQILIIIFSFIYGAISWSFAYYGEMITYLGMSAPMAVISLISWLRNPFMGKKSEVTVSRISKREISVMILFTIFVTIAFYFILDVFNTANLIPSTLSVTTSFTAAYLTYKRNAYFALAYALNDIVLIVLWVMATATDSSYLSVIICFVVFLANDLYSFFNWLRMQKRQEKLSKK